MSILPQFGGRAVLQRFWNSVPNQLKNTVRRFRDPETYMLYDQDFRLFQQDVQWIVKALSSRPQVWKGEVLFQSLHGFVPSFKEEFIFASMLVWYGYRPVFLVDRTDRVERYVELIPGVKLVDWKAFDPMPNRSELMRARDLLDNVKTVRDLVALVVGGVAIGRHAVSRFMQERQVGSIAIDAYREPLAAQLAASLAAIRAARKCLTQQRARIVLMNERGYTPFGEFFDLALIDRRRVVQYVSSHRDDSRVYKAYSTDTRSEHPYSLSVESWANALDVEFGKDQEKALLQEWEDFYREKTWFNFQRLQHLASLQDRGSIFAKLGLDKDKKTAVIYSHIFWDATFFYGESLYDDYKEWFVDTVRVANLNQNVNWVVKLHPVNVWRKERQADGIVRENYAEIEALAEAGIIIADHVKILMPDTDISSWSLFEASDYCLTVRGTVGIENAALGHRVVVAGSGHYSGRGFTLNPATVEEYRALLLRIEMLPPPTEDERRRALRYGYWLLKRKPYTLQNYRMRYASQSDVVHALNGSPEIIGHNVAEFFEESSVTRWVEWLTEDNTIDCLAPVGDGDGGQFQ